MSSDPIPDDIRELVVKSIDSVAQLEALLFLRELGGPGLELSALAQRLFAPEPEMAAAVAKLERDGFVTQDHATFRYEAPAVLAEKVDRLAAIYRRHLIPITNLIHSKPSAARTFSDAFKFRKE